MCEKERKGVMKKRRNGVKEVCGEGINLFQKEKSVKMKTGALFN